MSQAAGPPAPGPERGGLSAVGCGGATEVGFEGGPSPTSSHSQGPTPTPAPSSGASVKTDLGTGSKG